MKIRYIIRIAKSAHGDQKYGEVPYIVHLMMVARHFTDDLHIKVALLHDVVEDTYITIDELRLRFDDDIVDAVDAMSRRIGETYFEYIDRLSQNKLAVDVKIADLEENIYNATYVYKEYASLIPRYEKALRILQGVK